MIFLEAFTSVTAVVQLFPTMLNFANGYCFRLSSPGRVATFRAQDTSQDCRIFDTARNAMSSMSTAMRERFNTTPSIFGHFIDMLTEANETIRRRENPWDASFRFVSQHKQLIEDPVNVWLEKFVKIDINTDIPPGTIIKVPLASGEESFRMHQKFSGNGLVAYALTPVEKGGNLVPLIAFRCTELDPFKEEAINSMYSDVDTHIGEMGWKSCKEAFAALMNDRDFRLEDEKVQIVGYSLGATHAQYFIEEHFQHVSHGTFYNSPGINPTVAEAFAEKMHQTSLDSPMILQTFRTVGDPFHHFGSKHLGWGVDHPNLSMQLLEVEYSRVKTFDIKLHNKCIFHTEHFDYTVYECHDPEILLSLLDNTKRDPFSSSSEKLRGLLGGVLTSMIASFGFCFNFCRKLPQRISLKAH